MSVKIIEVSCAILYKDEKVFLAQRAPSKSQGLKWEFPGGKIEPAEDAKTALKREIMEELGISICICSKLEMVSWEPEKPQNLVIKLHPFVCKIVNGHLSLKEHIDGRWMKPDEILGSMDLSEADIPIVKQLLSENWRP